MHAYRTHNCGQLRASDVGANARLSGWVHRKRDHGGLLFIDLRDHYGLTQCVVTPSNPNFERLERIRVESVITVTGETIARSDETKNPNLPTGEIELQVAEVTIQSEAEELPLPVFAEPEYPEDIRLKYRFLDLRRETLHNHVILRSKIISSLRTRMIDQGFQEFQTPILTASSPEGARDFLVPSRMHPGQFYALPQAPQQFKQMLMVAGFDRYFQIAPCFRDEDARADRSPGEFYQLDFEMSYVTQEDVFAAIEPVLEGVFNEFGKGKTVTKAPFPRIPFAEAIRKYGSDKPDLRNPIEMQEVSDHFRDSGFKVFAGMLEKDPKVEVWAIPTPKGGSRAFCDRMNKWAQGEGQPGLGYIFWRDEELPNEASTDLEHPLRQISEQQQLAGKKTGEYTRIANSYIGGAGPVAKNIGVERTEAIRLQLGLGDGDAAFFVAGKPEAFYKFAGDARNQIARELDMISDDEFKFCWVIDFPMYEWDEDNKKIDFSHNPFSMPNFDTDEFLKLTADADKDTLLNITAFQYDIVCNGIELSSGAIRNHKPDVMLKAFEIAGYGAEVVEEKFGGMLNAFRYGAPPHGGSAPGVDRIVMLLAGVENLREVIAFPMNQQAQDVLMGAPGEVDPKQLKELHIKLAGLEKK